MEAVDYKKLFHDGAKEWNKWRQSNPDRVPDLNGVRLKESNIENYDFSKMNFKLRFFKNSKIRNINFSFAKLKASTFEGANIESSSFVNADLVQVNFESATLKNCLFYSSNIEFGKFKNAVLENCLFDFCTNLKDANFDKARIINSNIETANISESDILKSSFEGLNANVLECLQFEQEEAHSKFENEENERQKNQKKDYEQKQLKKSRLENEFYENVDEVNKVTNEISSLNHKLKIQRAYLEAFRTVEDLKEKFKNKIAAIESKIEIKARIQKKLNSKFLRLEEELSELRYELDGNIMYSLAMPEYISKKDIEFEFIERKTKLEIPRTFVNKSKKKNVNIGIYAVDKLEKGANSIIQVWLYRKIKKKKVSKLAKQFNPDVHEKARKSLFNRMERGDKITLILTANEFKYSEKKEFTWNGDKACENFKVKPPIKIDEKIKSITFSLLIFIQDLPVGDVHYSINLGDQSYLTKSNVGYIHHELNEFEKAFISYAAMDRKEVLARVQGLLLTEKFKIFLDVMNLAGAEKWQPRIYEEIENCDVFFLFWSKASKESKWVKKEIEFALDCKKESGIDKPRIHPIVIPPIQKPPKNLKKLHFNDPITQFILAEK